MHVLHLSRLMQEGESCPDSCMFAHLTEAILNCKDRSPRKCDVPIEITGILSCLLTFHGEKA